VETEGGEQADDTRRDGAGRENKAVMFGHFTTGKPVSPRADSLQQRVVNEPRERLRMDTSGGKVGGTDNAPSLGELKDLLSAGHLLHVVKRQ
jgi:hypothetical protein